MIKASIIGVTGYAGAELLRLLLNHPDVEIAAVSSVSFEGQTVNSVYNSFNSICEMTCVSADEAAEKGDVVFACLPHGLSQELAAKCSGAGKVFIDLGADFRLESEEDYTEWYGGKFLDKSLHESSVYALPELFREKIKGARVIANPGCYPTSAALALYPALQSKAVRCDGIIIDSKSGVTGAGRGLSQNTHFPDTNEAFAPYKIAVHRHTPEIEQTLSHGAGERLRITFVPHLLPVNRGIISTCYARLASGADEEGIRACYEDFYKDEKFVRLLPKGEIANIKNVQYSNYCDISLHFDGRTGTMVAVSAIDNMVKGAAGQAVQNMNIVFGLPEDTGLGLIPLSF